MPVTLIAMIKTGQIPTKIKRIPSVKPIITKKPIIRNKVKLMLKRLKNVQDISFFDQLDGTNHGI